jgi:2-polyprenyl-6-methoxyphenol hydroxylase-like FAD-dependent oxidoreductase
VLTHPDEHDIDESWSFPGKLSEVLEAVKTWDPMCTRIIEKTPEERLVDWKLVYRDPLPTWVSPRGRILLLGDSAHPFLPTSAQGATQALEDGVNIAVCLRRGGKDDIPEAVRTHERIRYDRVKAVQKTGETTRDMWHKTDWEKVKTDPESIQLPREDWVFHHDTEMHAEEVFDEARQEIRAQAEQGVDSTARL